MSNYLLNAVIKGLLEGFTEFLPISSTGHLILVDKLLPLASGDGPEIKTLNEVFDMIIQLPAIAAIVILYRQRLLHSVATLRTDTRSRNLWIGLLVAFVPIGVAGLALGKAAETLRHPVPVACALIIGGLLLLLVERSTSQPAVNAAEDTPLSTAVSIGVFQCLALFPGTSRSGATIVGGRTLGLSRMAAAEFSFFLAIPTMTAACLYKLAKEFKHIDWNAHGQLLLVGSVVSFFTAWAVVALFLKLLNSRYALAMWGWYRIVLGALVLVFASRLA